MLLLLYARQGFPPPLALRLNLMSTMTIPHDNRCRNSRVSGTDIAETLRGSFRLRRVLDVI